MLHSTNPLGLSIFISLSTFTLSCNTAHITCYPSFAHSTFTEQYALVLPSSLWVSNYQKSTSPARFPNPPINIALENGQILIVFLYLLPNSNIGLLFLSYNVAVAGYNPEITINCSPDGTQAISWIYPSNTGTSDLYFPP